MRNTLILATFVGIGASTVGAAAFDNVPFDGADTLWALTRVLTYNCPGADPTPLDQLSQASWDGDGLFFRGAGSAPGEEAMSIIYNQTVSPMSRFLTGERFDSLNGDCFMSPPASAQTSEGIVFALDGISVVTSASSGQSCNGILDDCDRTTDPSAGLAYSKTVTLPDASTYTFNSWRDVLRVLYAGMDHNAGHSIANRNCNSALRQAIADHWPNLFEGTCTTCSRVEHAFRPDDGSGTTQTFIALLDLPPLINVRVGSFTTPFCNAVLLSEPLPPNVNRLPPDFQDNDPIRRTCPGTNNGNTPANVATKQVCAAKRNLGLVLPIYGTSFLEPDDAVPIVQCNAGSFIYGQAPKILNPAGTGLTSVGARCPNGDVPVFGNSCLIPTTASGDPRCVAAFNTKPAFIFDNTPVDGQAPSGADGRVYNLHLRKADGTYQLDRRSPASRPIMGAFYRIHATRTMSGPDFTADPCQNQDGIFQIGCLVRASPCSIGFAGRFAAAVTDTVALKVNGLSVTDNACVRSMTYPLWRKLYLNTMVGFENVTGQELSLASCFSGTGLAEGNTIDSLVSGANFVPLGRPPYCEDFNEVAICGSVGPNTNACANNVAPIPGAATSTTCGNGVVEFLEECDEGPINGATGHCTMTCRFPVP
jgi:hypothetical protein